MELKTPRSSRVVLPLRYYSRSGRVIAVCYGGAMAQLTRTHRDVKRALTCLGDFKSRTLEEVTTEYNKIYPPGFRLFKITGDTIRNILNFLVHEELITFEVFTFWSEPIPLTKLYVITNAGFQHLNAKDRR